MVHVSCLVMEGSGQARAAGGASSTDRDVAPAQGCTAHPCGEPGGLRDADQEGRRRACRCGAGAAGFNMTCLCMARAIAATAEACRAIRTQEEETRKRMGVIIENNHFIDKDFTTIPARLKPAFDKPVNVAIAGLQIQKSPPVAGWFAAPAGVNENAPPGRIASWCRASQHSPPAPSTRHS